MVSLNLTLSPSQQDYLKSMYLLADDPDARVSTSVLADRLRIAPASVTEMLRKLADLGLVTYDRYRGASLTRRGRRMALEMVRHHRLVETFLTEVLGYEWDEVHDEAERLEHVISERLESRMFEALGRPQRDPHGDPIPTVDGNVTGDAHRALTSCAPTETVTIRRVSDAEPAKLRALASLGLRLGDRAQVLEPSEWASSVVLRIRKKRIEVPVGLAEAVFVE